ncbi:hypothetical protein Pfo_008345 [Paulownia fortunei]|nr:hypothetical protein Pfo_008345 [Paulownia fortunei]
MRPIKFDMPISDLKFRTEDKTQHSKYIVRVVLSYLKHFVVGQNMEREEEAIIQGLSITGLQLPKANFSDNDQGQCNNCKTCIFDPDRSCLNCLYKLCITCREIRDGFPPGNGKYHMRDVGCNFTTKDGSSRAASSCMDFTKLVSEWKLKEKGTTVCPPEGMGGCGRGNLELKSTSPDNWVSELLRKAESAAEVGKLTNALEASEGTCSCLRSNQGNELDSAESCKTAS